LASWFGLVTLFDVSNRRKEGRAEKMLVVAYFNAASFALEASCPDFPMGCLFMLHLVLFSSRRRIVSQEALKGEGTKYEGAKNNGEAKCR
jgi:hypothetical protein